MKKYLLLLFLAASIPASAHISSIKESQSVISELSESEQSQPTPKVSAKGRTIRVQGATGLTLEIYDITGKLVHSQQLDSPDKTITPDVPKGIYLVRIGKYTRKLALN